jgi:hypothetical protein
MDIWRFLDESALIASHKEWLKWMHLVPAASLFSTLLVFEPILVNLALKGVRGNTTDITGVIKHVFFPGQPRHVSACWTAHHEFSILTNSWLWPEYQLDWKARNTKSIHVANKKKFTSTLQIPGETGYTQCLAYIKHITGCFNRHLNISNMTSIRGALWSIKLTNIISCRVWNRTP